MFAITLGICSQRYQFLFQFGQENLIAILIKQGSSPENFHDLYLDIRQKAGTTLALVVTTADLGPGHSWGGEGENMTFM